MTPSPWPDDPQHLRLKPPTRIAVASPCLPLPALATHGKVHASSMSLPVAFPSPLPLHSQWLPSPRCHCLCYGCLLQSSIAPTRPPPAAPLCRAASSSRWLRPTHRAASRGRRPGQRRPRRPLTCSHLPRRPLVAPHRIQCHPAPAPRPSSPQAPLPSRSPRPLTWCGAIGAALSWSGCRTDPPLGWSDPPCLCTSGHRPPLPVHDASSSRAEDEASSSSLSRYRLFGWSFDQTSNNTITG